MTGQEKVILNIGDSRSRFDYILVRMGMDVNGHERLSNITLRHRLK
jgi:hypothetical protein